MSKVIMKISIIMGISIIGFYGYSTSVKIIWIL